MRSPASSAASPSFAGLLASLAAGPAKSRSPWEEQLADDVTTLSYESVLRAGAPRTPDAGPAAAAPEHLSAEASVLKPGPVDAKAPSLYKQKLKTASITIRLSKSERDQLLRRAGEAGLSVSAYLRSCTFEVESLRAQVKDTMRQLREAAVPPQEVAPAPRISPWLSCLGWLRRLFSPWRTSQRPAHA